MMKNISNNVCEEHMHVGDRNQTDENSFIMLKIFFTKMVA